MGSAASTPFHFSQRVGILFTVEGAVLSLVAVGYVMRIALIKWLRRTAIIVFGRERASPDASDSSLFLSLMTADLVQALGFMPNLKWMVDASITEGSLCTAQAVFKQGGTVAVALSSLAIAIHTFAVLVLRWIPPRHTSKIAVILTWILTALIIGIPNAVHRYDGNPLYGPTSFWCWISADWPTERLVAMYLWVWVAAFAMLILYGIMFCVLRGWLDIGGVPDTEDPETPGCARKSRDSIKINESREDKETRAIAKMMLYFPAVYIATILPNSITRWMEYVNPESTPPAEGILFANTILGLSGLFNVTLFFLTRPTMVVGEKITIEMGPPALPPLNSTLTSNQSSREAGHSYQPDDVFEVQHVSRDTSMSAGLLSGHDVHHSHMALSSTLPYNAYLTSNSEMRHGRSRIAQYSNSNEGEGDGELDARLSDRK